MPWWSPRSDNMASPSSSSQGHPNPTSSIEVREGASFVTVPADNAPTQGGHPGQPPRKNRPNILAKLCMCFIGTRQMVDNDSTEDLDTFYRTTLIELIIYLLYFTVLFSVMLASASTSSAYYYTKVITALLVDTPIDESGTTFRTSTETKHFWKFTETAMLDALFWESWYHDTALNIAVKEVDEGVLYENILMGRARLRQIRVIEIPCGLDEWIRLGSRKCYPKYSQDYEHFGKFHPEKNDTAWKYFTEDELNGTSYWGNLGDYSGGGAYQLLDLRENVTTQIIQDLKQNLWIRRPTRVVFLEFTLYNVNLNLFCTVRLAWEFPSTGGMITTWRIQPVRLIRFVQTLDYLITGGEILFVLFTFYYTMQELAEIIVEGIVKYFQDLWQYLDWLILFISYTSIGLNVYRSVLLFKKGPKLIEKGLMRKDFVDFSTLAFIENVYYNIMAICLFFVWVKIFKYVSFNATMSQLSLTLSRCAKDVAAFSFLFCIVFFAFAHLGFLLFGAEVEDFKSTLNATFTLLRLIMGDFNFRAILTANYILGPTYFVSYIFFVFFVLLNMFLAIINDTYSEVKAELRVTKPTYLFSDYLTKHVLKLASKNKKNDNDSSDDPSETNEGMVGPSEFKAILLRNGFSKEEAELFIERYELNHDHALDGKDTGVMITALEGNVARGRGERRKSSLQRKSLPEIVKPHDEIDRIDHRIGTIETSLSTTIAKLEFVLKKL